MNTYVIERKGDSVVSFLLNENNRAIEIHADALTTDAQVGDIYIGKIEKYLPEIGTAFVRITPELTGAIQLSGASGILITGGSAKKLAAGSEVAVQISTQAIKSKRPGLSANLSLRGSYCVVTYGNPENGVSKKIRPDRREELRTLAQQIGDETYGCLIRTNAAATPDDEILEEGRRLKEKLQELIRKAAFSMPGACLYRTPPMYLERLHSLRTEELVSIRTEDPEITEAVRSYIQEHVPYLEEYFKPYTDTLAGMDKIFSLEREMDHALSKTVYMKSGAFLVIEPTEALTVIDVNTGKSSGMLKHKEKEAVFLKTNLEAAKECARQIRLRNISGIIIIDFINMTEEKSYQTLISSLKKLLMDDPVKSVYVDRTALGLVEITRKKIEQPLFQAVKAIREKASKNT